MVFFPLMNSVLYEVVPRSKYLSFPALLFLLTTIETIIDNHRQSYDYNKVLYSWYSAPSC